MLETYCTIDSRAASILSRQLSQDIHIYIYIRSYLKLSLHFSCYQHRYSVGILHCKQHRSNSHTTILSYDTTLSTAILPPLLYSTMQYHVPLVSTKWEQILSDLTPSLTCYSFSFSLFIHHHVFRDRDFGLNSLRTYARLITPAFDTYRRRTGLRTLYSVFLSGRVDQCQYQRQTNRCFLASSYWHLIL